jgi:hypothetical protein
MNEPWCIAVLGYGRGVFAVSLILRVILGGALACY